MPGPSGCTGAKEFWPLYNWPWNKVSRAECWLLRRFKKQRASTARQGQAWVISLPR